MSVFSIIRIDEGVICQCTMCPENRTSSASPYWQFLSSDPSIQSGCLLQRCSMGIQTLSDSHKNCLLWHLAPVATEIKWIHTYTYISRIQGIIIEMCLFSNFLQHLKAVWFYWISYFLNAVIQWFYFVNLLTVQTDVKLKHGLDYSNITNKNNQYTT